MVGHVVPRFGVGETAGPLTYAKEAVPRLCRRLGLEGGKSEELEHLFTASFEANARRMERCLSAPFVDRNPESCQLTRTLFDRLIDWENSSFAGMSHFRAALDFMEAGGNVLLVSNHTSGADLFVLERAIERRFPGVTQDWSWMVGHVVNIWLIPMVIFGAFNRHQIFSAKYCAQAPEDIRTEMKTHNSRSLATLGRVSSGGRLVVLYPEGGRGDNCVMKSGVPQTMTIPREWRPRVPRV